MHRAAARAGRAGAHGRRRTGRLGAGPPHGDLPRADRDRAAEANVRPLVSDDYPHLLDIPTRWNDNDVYGHVNNVEYYAFFDTVINPG